MIQKVTTGDSTESFLNEEVGETYHSMTGAVEEAMKKYVEPCQIIKKAKTGELHILDVCFGLGYNSAMAISKALEENPDCIIHVIGLEYDLKIVQKIQEVSPPISFYPHYKKLSGTMLEFKEGNVTVTLVLGDAQVTVLQVPSLWADAIFYDPFSPKIHPHLWSVDLFTHMYRILKPDGILATYSCARIVREHMAEANLFYDDGPKVKRRGPGTIATKWLEPSFSLKEK